MITIKNLVKSYGKKEVLKSLSTVIEDGKVVVVIGPSGSGKSTFLRCLNKLEQVNGGQIFFNDVQITDENVYIDKIRQKIGM